MSDVKLSNKKNDLIVNIFDNMINLNLLYATLLYIK